MLITEYKTVSAPSVEELDIAVNKAIKSKKNWQPFGNVYIDNDVEAYTYYHQPMIAYKNNS